MLTHVRSVPGGAILDGLDQALRELVHEAEGDSRRLPGSLWALLQEAVQHVEALPGFAASEGAAGPRSLEALRMAQPVQVGCSYTGCVHALGGHPLTVSQRVCLVGVRMPTKQPLSRTPHEMGGCAAGASTLIQPRRCG